MKYKLVYIEWADAVHNDDWKHSEDLNGWIDSDDWIIKNVGWIYEETDKYIILFSAMADEQERNNYQVAFSSMWKIPKTWIRKRKVLKL